MYGLRLGLLGSSELTWRRFGVLLRGLPPGSAFAAALTASGEVEVEEKFDPSEWSLSDQLTGLMLDTLAIANWQRGGKGNAPKGIMQTGRRNPDAPKQSLSQDAIRSTLEALAPTPAEDAAVEIT